MKRKVIQIDQEKCTGCGECVPNCPEGAIRMIDGKARLVGDLLCDGLGACIGHCPVDAISIEEREAEAYDERKVMENIVPQGANTIRAHLEHLRDHGDTVHLKEAVNMLNEKGIPVPTGPSPAAHSGCPGSRSMNFTKPAAGGDEAGERPSQLGHWPIQLHLMSPAAPQYQGADMLLCADCVAYAVGDFHKYFLKGKSLAIACPKLDEGQDSYIEKIKALIDEARINTLTVMIMEVPCCMGLLDMARQAAAQAKRKVPLKCVLVGLQGDILREEWL